MAIQINPLSDVLGAEVTGIDLRKPLDPETIDKIYKAFIENVVIVFRNQDMDHKQFLAAAKNFGEPKPRRDKQRLVDGSQLISYVTNELKHEDGRPKVYGCFWHTDHSYQPEPPKATMLNPVTLPQTGGDTCFANTRSAYDALSETMKVEIKDLKAVHFFKDRRKPPSREEREQEAAGTADAITDGVAHPVTCTHADHGGKAIYINPLRVKRFVGMAPEESVQMIDALARHATQDQFVYRHTWQPGDVIMWDNRQALHKATEDWDLTQKRVLHRVLLKGDKPS
ncbi:MAG: TauD/TfdA family dioxygenase [Rhodospirillaceae bacterium]